MNRSMRSCRVRSWSAAAEGGLASADRHPEGGRLLPPGLVEPLEPRVLFSVSPSTGATKATVATANLSAGLALNAATRAAFQSAADPKAGPFRRLGGGLGRAFAEYTQYRTGGAKGRFHSR